MARFCLVWLTCFAMLSMNAFSLPKHMVLHAKSCAQFVVSLPANATTGFQWSLLDYDKERFRFEKDIYTPSKPEMPGAPGEHVFYFSLKKQQICPKKTKLCFRYSRAWEQETATYTSVIVRFSKKIN